MASAIFDRRYGSERHSKVIFRGLRHLHNAFRLFSAPKKSCLLELLSISSSRIVKPFLLLLMLTGLSCGSCALYPHSSGSPFGPNDYAFMSAQPYPKETLLAQKRFQDFVRRANAKERSTLAETPFVAVRAYQLNASEVPGLIPRMALGKVPMKAFYGSDLLNNPGSVPVEFLLIFDQRTGRLAAPDGVLVVGSPVRGKVGRFGGVWAVYADGGRW